ncbi:MAG: helix-turn-helix transcriptional regulator [Bacillota bacterium]|nr:helix-turn-helix transcriptional regulator [Bacillota bacterium]
MFNKDMIETYMDKKGWTKYKLAKEAGIGQSTLSEILSGKKKNPSVNTLQKIASALEVSFDELMGSKTNKPDNDDSIIAKEVEEVYPTGEFKTPEDAIKFILSQPTIMGFGGFDIKRMSDDEIMDFANELLRQLKLISYKFKK